MPGNSPLISIIIPVYGTEPHLPKCLDSVVGQTFKNIEIIVVDDGSPGNCKEICARYPQVLYCAYGGNRGVFRAREYGTRAAKGKYIFYLDSDDSLPARICSRIAQAGDFDLLLAEVVTSYPHHREKSPWFNQGLKEAGTTDFFNIYISRTYLSWGLGKVFRKDLSLKIYDELAVDRHLVLSEDFLFFTAYAFYVQNPKVLKDTAYCYYVGGESINRTALTEEKLEKHFQDLGYVVSKTREFFMNKNAPPLKPLEEELLYAFLARFTESSAGEGLLKKFLSRITALYGVEVLSSYILPALTVQKNPFLRGLLKLGAKIFPINSPGYRFFRACAGILRTLFRGYR